MKKGLSHMVEAFFYSNIFWSCDRKYLKYILPCIPNWLLTKPLYYYEKLYSGYYSADRYLGL